MGTNTAAREVVPINRLRRLIHRIGHFFDMDCGVTNEHRPGFSRCKACNAEVSTLPRQWRTK